MIRRKVLYKIQNFCLGLNSRIKRLGLSFGYILFIFVTFSFIAFLSFNIYKTVSNAEKNYKIKLEEREKNEALIAESDELDQQIEYLESVDATRNLATSGYRLAKPGEDLYVIERDDIEYDYIEDPNQDPIDFSDNKFWWGVVLGI